MMRMKEKLDELAKKAIEAKKFYDEHHFPYERLCEIFGDGFEKRLFPDYSSSELMLFFEENGKVYECTFGYIYDRDYIKIFFYDDSFYREIKAEDVHYHIELMEQYQRGIEELKKVLNHPSIRVKRLFK